MDWKTEVEKLNNQGLKIIDIVAQVEPTMNMPHSKAYNLVKKYIYRHCNKPHTETENGVPKKSTYTYKDGISTYEEIVKDMGEEITPQSVMTAHKLKADEWEVVSFTRNLWQQTKDGETKDLYQIKLTVKPKKSIELTFTDIENFFKNKDFRAKVKVEPFEYSITDEMLEIDYVDPHNGLLTWREETGYDYDLKISTDRYLQCIADVVRRCKDRTFKFIRLVKLGDDIHIDNDEQKTTKGTFQQSDGRISKIFNMTADTNIAVINELLKLKAPIEFIYIPGNHDRNTGYFLSHTLRSYFSNNPNVTFDISPNPMKAKIYGKALIGYHHGDMPKKNLADWILTDYRKEYGESSYCEIHSGHYHNKNEYTQSNIQVVSLPALCENSYWEHQQGYRSERALMCYVWHERYGKRETWITHF